MYQSKVGTFTAPLGTLGTPVFVTDVGFQPKIILFFHNNSLVNGSLADAMFCMGAALSSSSQFSMGFLAKNGDSTIPLGLNSWHSDTECISIRNESNTLLLSAQFVEFTNDGFRVDFSTVNGVATLIGYLALGGDELSDLYIGSFDSNIIPSEREVTEVGFEADCLMFFASGLEFGGEQANVNLAAFSYGFAIKNWFQKTAGALIPNELPTVPSSYQNTLFCFGNLLSPTVIRETARLNEVTSDGFKLQFTATSNAGRIFFIALKGGKYAVSRLDQNIADLVQTGPQSKVGIGIKPAALLLISTDKVSGTTPVGDFKLSLGIGDKSLNQISYFAGLENGVSTTNASRNRDITKIIRMLLPQGAFVQNASEAELISMDGDGFTLDWAELDLTEREIIILTLGNQTEMYLRSVINDFT